MEFHRMRKRRTDRRIGEWLEVRAQRLLLSQDDLSVANAAGSVVRADINANLQALGTRMSGTSGPATTYAHMLWADTTNGILKRRNAANSAWIAVETLDESFVLARSSNTILDGSDVGKAIIATSTFTQTLTAAATLGDGWWCYYKNNGTGTITLDPNSSEQINGATTLALAPGHGGLLWCNGTAFFMDVAPSMDNGQIKFPATQNASSDANTLDDYEEGTWSPVLTDGSNDATMTGTTGVYTKIGRHVFFSAVVATSALGSVSGAVSIKGLPFTAAAHSAIAVGLGSGLSITAGRAVAGYVASSATTISLTLWSAAGGVSNLQATEWTDDGALRISGHYIV